MCLFNQKCVKCVLDQSVMPNTKYVRYCIIDTGLYLKSTVFWEFRVKDQGSGIGDQGSEIEGCSLLRSRF